MTLAEEYSELLRPQIIAPVRTKEALVLPAGFADGKGGKGVSIGGKLVDVDGLKNKKIWELATSPAKSIPMNLIMSYMTGNSLQLIPIMMTLMLLINPLKAIFNDTRYIFNGLRTPNNSLLVLQGQVVYVLCQIACMSVGVWKLNKMGLIPNKEADWMSFKTPVVSERVLVV